MSTGMICDGIAASEAIDSSGEILDVAGCDISDFEEGRGTINWEHRGSDSEGASANDTVGRILFAKKIFSAEDCSDDRQLEYWRELQLPMIYIIYRLFDGSGHPGATALAAIMRDCKKNQEKNIIGLSIEGTTLKKEKGGNRLLRSVARRVAATEKPCNKSALSNVLSDPNDPTVQKQEHQHPLFARITDSVTSGISPIIDPENLTKALAAGSYNTAPSELSGGAALQVEDKSLRNRIKAAARDWDRKTPFVKFLKHKLPEVSDEFLDRFSGLVQDLTLKKAQKAAVKQAVSKKVVGKLKAKGVTSPTVQEEPLTIRGTPAKVAPDVKLHFDEKQGVLHTPRGSFPMYIPSRDSETPDAAQKFENILNDPKVGKFHDYAMENWSKLHQRLKAGNLPPEVVMHGVLFSQMSPNCLDAETEALTQRGWVPGFELKMDDILLTKNPQTGQLEWHRPKDLRFFPDYEGELVQIKTRSFDVITTPAHRWLVTTPRGSQKIRSSQELVVGDRIHRTGLPLDLSQSGLTPDEASLLGWFVTDGYYKRPTNSNTKRTGRALFETPGVYAFLCQSAVGNAAKCEMIDQLIGRLGGCTSSRIGKDGKKVWNLGPKLTKMLLARAPDRYLTVGCLLDLDLKALQNLRDAMFLGDGNSWTHGNWTSKKQLTTGRQEQAEAFQVLLAMTGQASSLMCRDMSKYTPKSLKLSNVPKMSRVWIVTALNRKFVNFDPKSRTTFSAKKGVWCPIVPNEVFVARRRGQVFCTLNTPVPNQELMYSHLVDAMNSTGKDPRSKEGLDVLRRDWLDRDQPQKWPEHSREHFQRLEGQLRLQNDSKTNGRVVGDIGAFMLANNKFKNVEQYHTLHNSLVDLIGRHKGDARSGVEELMFHKDQAKKWDAMRSRAQISGRPDPGEYTAGPSVPGLAPKTARYTYGMLGGGNVIVPDTHFARYLFGLDKDKDIKSIDYIKDQLWDTKNTHVMNAIDRYYGQHHDAVKHMQSHPVWGKHFEKPEDAIFPAFWKNWVSIVPHEKARGMSAWGWNESTDHRPFWEAVGPYLRKNETDTNLAARTAKTHHDWVEQYGEMPAQLLYFRYLVPQLLEAAEKREAQQAVMKFESVGIDLKKAAVAKKPAVYSIPDSVQFGGKMVKPGVASIHSADAEPNKLVAILGHNKTHFISVPAEKVRAWDKTDLVKLPKNMSGRTFTVRRHPEDIAASSVVDHAVHGEPEYTHHPEVRAMIHGLDFDKQSNTPAGVEAGMNDSRSFWTRSPNGKRVYIKGVPTEKFSEAHREALYHNLAKDFYGMGQYVTPTALVTHPKTGDKVSVIQHTGGQHFNGRFEHLDQLNELKENGELHKIALMDMINDNADRHLGNFTLGADGLKLIDHGLTFSSKPFYVGGNALTAEVDADEEPIHPEAVKWVSGLKPDELDQQMRRHNVPEVFIDEARRRLQALKQHLKTNPGSLADAVKAPFNLDRKTHQKLMGRGAKFNFGP